ncbi:hypothetical protein SAMN04488514_11669 [Kriegella aquimaris]|uniref:Uncharacterized protein n=1 Tax=Kriegella aquimaris TaxID=192904 RepID=A0A1G9WVS8_9FLAO|nr:hypothetical protein SAMN04488514_11669 [Kriegella aquimaris]
MIIVTRLSESVAKFIYAYHNTIKDGSSSTNSKGAFLEFIWVPLMEIMVKSVIKKNLWAASRRFYKLQFLRSINFLSIFFEFLIDEINFFRGKT